MKTGIEVLAQSRFAKLSGQRIGLVTNPTGVLPNLRSTIDTLAAAPNVKLRALFGPEHGVRGDATAGSAVASSKDAATGLPVYSLYGKTTKPTAAMLSGLDVLVFDIQDIGSRSYTYLATLARVMEGAAENKIPLVVLDRPNPAGLHRVEGTPIEAAFKSFVSPLPVPYLHGLTLGEMAKMINGRGWLPGGRTCELTVVPCEGLTRAPGAVTPWPWPTAWVPTSPHVPKPESALFYAVTGIVGELPAVSIGVGYPLPFELAGAPGASPLALARDLAGRGLTGYAFRPMTWTPFYGTFKGRSCGGVQIYLTDPARAELTRPNFEIMDALRRQNALRGPFAESESTRMFDLACGTDKIRKAFVSGASSAQLWAMWNAGRDAFVRDRKPYLIY